MSNTYKWSVGRITVRAFHANLPNVITGANWSVTASDGLNVVSRHGFIHLGPPDEVTFKPIDQMSEAEILAIVKGELWTETIEAELDDELKKLRDDVRIPVDNIGSINVTQVG